MSSILNILKYLFVAFVSIYLYHQCRPTKIINGEAPEAETIYIDCVEVVIDTFEIIIPQKIDTQRIIADYHTRKEISSEYQDKNILIRMKDVLYKNNVDKRTLDYTLLPRADPMKVFVNTQMSVGENGGGMAIGLSVLKNRKQFSIGYDPITNRTIFGFNYQIKIRSPTRRNRKN